MTKKRNQFFDISDVLSTSKRDKLNTFVPFELKDNLRLREDVDDELCFEVIKEEGVIFLNVAFTKTNDNEDDGPVDSFNIQVSGIQEGIFSAGKITLKFPAKVLLEDLTVEILLSAVIATKGKFFVEDSDISETASIYLVVEVSELGISCCACISDMEKWEDFFEVIYD